MKRDVLTLLSIKGKTRCPYLAIPIPGERPFVVERKHFESVTRKITITETTLKRIEGPDHKAKGLWALTIQHHTGNVRGRYVFYNLLQTRFATNYDGFKREMWKWAESYRRVGVRKSETPFEKQIRQLSKEIDKLHLGKPPLHPLLPGPYTREFSESVRETILAWRNGKAERKRIARIAALALRCKITDRQAYDALRALGYKVTSYCKITSAQRRYWKMEGRNDYWQRLYTQCGLANAGYNHKIYHGYCDQRALLPESFTRHAEARVEYLATKRQAESLQNQIN